MNRIAPTLSGKYRLWRGPIPGTHESGFVEQPLVERERDAAFAAVRRLIGGGHTELYGFRMGECNILLGREPGGIHGELRWHLTISCPDRHPSWDEIKTARYRLLGPDTVVAMVLPQAEHYVNVPAQDHVMQLWEIVDEARFWEQP